MRFRAWLSELLEAGVYRSQYHMAEAFQSKQPTVNHWLQGVRFPSRVSCVKISRATGKPLGEIVEMVDEDTRPSAGAMGFRAWLRRLLEDEVYGSQYQAARRLGVKPPTLNRWLQGTRRPDRESCAKISEVTGKAIDEIVQMVREDTGPSADVMGFRAWLRRLLEAGVYRSQYDMAEAFDSKQPTVNHWLQGVRFPNRGSCAKISEATGKAIDEIVEMVREDTGPLADGDQHPA